MFGSKHSNKKPAEAGLVGNKKAHVLDGVHTACATPCTESGVTSKKIR
jgi:hypothetical protein